MPVARVQPPQINHHQFFGSIGLNPGNLMALLAGAAEFFGGLALLAVSVSLMFSGAGRASLDRVLSGKSQ